MNKLYLSIAAMTLFSIGHISAQSYFDDDIYYNPKKDTKSSTKDSSRRSNYISDMASMDVDAYNRRGEQYYISSIDTIGAAVENGEDFIYTQQIQKYYNPTIVVDNADILGDVLSDAYGNVEIVINNNGLPVFSPYYSWGWNYPYNYWSPWSWNLSFGGWGWNFGFYDPWYWGPSWGWGPSWAWGPSWGWGPGPNWGWGPGPNPGRPIANWRPAGNRRVGPNSGWANNTRPGGNYNGGYNMAHRVPAKSPAGNPGGVNNSAGRPNLNYTSNVRQPGVVNNNGKWEYKTDNKLGNISNNRVNTPSMSTHGVREPAKASTNKVSTPTNKNTVNTNNGRVINQNNTNRNNTTIRNNTPRNNSNVSRGNTGVSRGTGGGGGRGRHR